jgi:outer membrane protein assembly factor BamB
MQSARHSLLASVGLALASAAGASDWNTAVGRDAGRTGLSPETGPDAAELLWQTGRPSLIAQQGCAAGNLFFTNRIQSFALPNGTWITAQSIETGAEAWAVQLPFDVQNPSHRSKVTAVRDGHVYATRAGDTKEDYLYALDPADGSIVWQSEHKIGEETTESVSFASDGDIVSGNFSSIMRIDKDDGSTLWTSPRTCPTSNGCSVAVSGNRVYLWEASGSGPIVTALDLATGANLYSTPAVAGGIVQQIGLFVGPDGTVYAPRAQNNAVTDFLVSYTDTGSGFVENWRVPLGYVPFASFGIGPDGTVYSYSRDLRVIRLDPADGSVVNSSNPLPGDFPFQPRMAIDATGKVFVTNGGFAQGRLFSFDADLTLRWSVPVANVNVGGPVLCQNGTLLVCGIGTDVRAYRTDPTAAPVTASSPPAMRIDPAVPNPFVVGTSIRFELAGPSKVSVRLFDVGGRALRSLAEDVSMAAGPQALRWDGCDERGRAMPAGVYFYRVETAGQSGGGRLVRLAR